jgi:hypothetical protein
MATTEDDEVLKKGTAELLVLAQLEGQARHGYEIAQQIAACLFSPHRSIRCSIASNSAGSFSDDGSRRLGNAGGATTG